MFCFEDVRSKQAVNSLGREVSVGTKQCGGAALSTGNINTPLQPSEQRVWLINCTFDSNRLKPLNMPLVVQCSTLPPLHFPSIRLVNGTQ